MLWVGGRHPVETGNKHKLLIQAGGTLSKISLYALAFRFTGTKQTRSNQEEQPGPKVH